MKVALVTTPPTVRSGIGDYTRHLLPYLREHADVEVFVDPAHAGATWDDVPLRTVDELVPREFDHVLYQLGNEKNHAFMARMVRAIGGTVMQHDWVLFDLAMAAFPGLARGGPKGHTLALREGGMPQAVVYAKNWLDRRRQRRHPAPSVDPTTIEGTLLIGWHEPEDHGRWTADHAAVRVPDDGVERIEIDVHLEGDRTLRVLQGERLLLETRENGIHTIDLVEFDRPVVTFETLGVRVTREQRRHGDARRLGTFFTRLSWKGESGTGDLDLEEPCVYYDTLVNLSRDRFLLPFNRSIVRFADSFIVHSAYVRDLILRDRNATTPIGILHHGAESRWHDEDRAVTRERLGLDQEWRDAFLVTSFGGVQAHKRIDKALEALAVARRGGKDIRMVLAGKVSSEAFDPIALAARLGLSKAVRFAGFVSEEAGWDWLHAGDVALNLRGPSSGGTSGGIFQAFSFGRPVIASDAAEQRELPDSCVLKVPLGLREVPTIAETLLALADDPARRAELEAGARRFVEEECHWGVVARQYVEYLERFPQPRTSRRGLVSMRLALQKSRAAAT